MKWMTVGDLIDGNVGEVILAGPTSDPRKRLVGRMLILTEAAFKRPPSLYSETPREIPYLSQLIVTDVVQPFGAARPRLVVGLLSDGPSIASSDQFELNSTTHIIA